MFPLEQGSVRVFRKRAVRLILCLCFFAGCGNPSAISIPIDTLHPAHPHGESAAEPAPSTILAVDDSDFKKAQQTEDHITDHAGKSAHHAHHAH